MKIRDREHLIEELRKCNYKGDIGSWDVSAVEDFSRVFKGSDFNGDISGWDVSNGKNFDGMFAYSSFDGDISNWDVSRGRSFVFMLPGAPFDGDLSSWELNADNEKLKYFLYRMPNWRLKVENCGSSKRTVYKGIFKNKTLYFAGCFVGTYEEIIEAIKAKYKGKARRDYIAKINKLRDMS